MTDTATETRAESQHQRWFKYGLNVAISIILVLALAVLIIWAAQASRKRVDMTASGLYSLKPQTLNIIRDLKKPVKIVSLYPKTDLQNKPIEEAQIVSDLLEEYRTKSKNIQVESVDPIREKEKVDALYNELVSRYGGELKKYQVFIDKFVSRDLPALQKQFGTEADAVSGFASQKQELEDAAAITGWLQDMPDSLNKVTTKLQQQLKEKKPDYSGIAGQIRQVLDAVSQNLSSTIVFAQAYGRSPQLSPPARTYFADCTSRLQAIKKQAEDLTAEASKLGTVKSDEAQQALDVKNPILVMGEKDYRVISGDQVWQVDEQATRVQTSERKVKPRFAGEQQITTAILTLSEDKKPKVVFIRPGGAPLTNPGFMGFIQGGPLSKIADRLRDANFEVMEKDLSGRYAQQAAMQGMPADKEPTDEEMKDAVWIVLDTPVNPQQMQMGMGGKIGPMLAQHLKEGGSGLVLAMPQGEDLSQAVGDWGVTIHSDMIAVHQPVPSTGTRTGDLADEAQRIQFIFSLTNYGDHPLTQPLRSLESIILPIVPIQTTTKPGYAASSIVPIPQTLKTWGTRQVDEALDGKEVTYDAKNDLAAPLYGGAAVEKEKGGRLVVLGSLDFLNNRIVRLPDPELLREGINAARFPGNAELFADSVFWLAKADTLLAISPTAMDVSRIKDMSDGTLAFWHYGVLIGILPALVLVAGVVVYLKRRD